MTKIRYHSIPKNKKNEGRDMLPNTWEHAGMETIFICCQDCEQIFVLTDHAIDDEGKVSPSVVCPYKRCNFHNFVQLEDFEDERL